MHQAVEQSAALVLAGELASGQYLTGHSLLFLATEACHGYIDVASGAAAWMAQGVTLAVGAVVILLLFAIFPTGMGEDHGRELWFLLFIAETLVSGHHILSIAIIAVGACPAIECQQFLSHLLGT